jgi:hypothetical protein
VWRAPKARPATIDPEGVYPSTNMADGRGPNPSEEPPGEEASRRSDESSLKPKRVNPNDVKELDSFLTQFEAYADESGMLETVLAGKSTFDSVCDRNEHLDRYNPSDKPILNDIYQEELVAFNKANRRMFNKLTMLVDISKSRKYSQFCKEQSATRDGRSFLFKLRGQISLTTPERQSQLLSEWSKILLRLINDKEEQAPFWSPGVTAREATETLQTIWLTWCYLNHTDVEHARDVTTLIIKALVATKIPAINVRASVWATAAETNPEHFDDGHAVIASIEALFANALPADDLPFMMKETSHSAGASLHYQRSDAPVKPRPVPMRPRGQPSASFAFTKDLKNTCLLCPSRICPSTGDDPSKCCVFNPAVKFRSGGTPADRALTVGCLRHRKQNPSIKNLKSFKLTAGVLKALFDESIDTELSCQEIADDDDSGEDLQASFNAAIAAYRDTGELPEMADPCQQLMLSALGEIENDMLELESEEADLHSSSAKLFGMQGMSSISRPPLTKWKQDHKQSFSPAYSALDHNHECNDHDQEEYDFRASYSSNSSTLPNISALDSTSLRMIGALATPGTSRSATPSPVPSDRDSGSPSRTSTRVIELRKVESYQHAVSSSRLMADYDGQGWEPVWNRGKFYAKHIVHVDSPEYIEHIRICKAMRGRCHSLQEIAHGTSASDQSKQDKAGALAAAQAVIGDGGATDGRNFVTGDGGEAARRNLKMADTSDGGASVGTTARRGILKDSRIPMVHFSPVPMGSLESEQDSPQIASDLAFAHQLHKNEVARQQSTDSHSASDAAIARQMHCNEIAGKQSSIANEHDESPNVALQKLDLPVELAVKRDAFKSSLQDCLGYINSLSDDVDGSPTSNIIEDLQTEVGQLRSMLDDVDAFPPNCTPTVRASVASLLLESMVEPMKQLESNVAAACEAEAAAAINSKQSKPDAVHEINPSEASIDFTKVGVLNLATQVELGQYFSKLSTRIDTVANLQELTEGAVRDIGKSLEVYEGVSPMETVTKLKNKVEILHNRLQTIESAKVSEQMASLKASLEDLKTSQSSVDEITRDVWALRKEFEELNKSVVSESFSQPSRDEFDMLLRNFERLRTQSQRTPELEVNVELAKRVGLLEHISQSTTAQIDSAVLARLSCVEDETKKVMDNVDACISLKLRDAQVSGSHKVSKDISSLQDKQSKHAETVSKHGKLISELTKHVEVSNTKLYTRITSEVTSAASKIDMHAESVSKHNTLISELTKHVEVSNDKLSTRITSEIASAASKIATSVRTRTDEMEKVLSDNASSSLSEALAEQREEIETEFRLSTNELALRLQELEDTSKQQAIELEDTSTKTADSASVKVPLTFEFNVASTELEDRVAQLESERVVLSERLKHLEDNRATSAGDTVSVGIVDSSLSTAENALRMDTLENALARMQREIDVKSKATEQTVAENNKRENVFNMRLLAASTVSAVRKWSGPMIWSALLCVAVALGTMVFSSATSGIASGLSNVLLYASHFHGGNANTNHAVMGMMSASTAHAEAQLPAVTRSNAARLAAIARDDNWHLWDSGSTHIVHESDIGCIPGTWNYDVPGMRLGDNGWMDVTGSCEKLFFTSPFTTGAGSTRVHEQPSLPIRRRVLIAPTVSCRVWSHGVERDFHGSYFADDARGARYTLANGSTLQLKSGRSGLRYLFAQVCADPTPFLSSAKLDALISNEPSPAPHAMLAFLAGSCVAPHVSLHNITDTVWDKHETAIMRMTGVGKRPTPLSSLDWLRLLHCRFNHCATRVLIETIESGNLVLTEAKLAGVSSKQFDEEHCSVCNTFKQHRVSDSSQEVRPAGKQKVSVHRALRPLHRIVMDVKGPIPVPSAQHGFRFVIGWTCECTGMRWVEAAKTHTELVTEQLTQRLRAALRITHPHLQFEIVRSDNASEYHSQPWLEYSDDSSFFREYIVPYASRMLGAMERAWGINEPCAAALLNQGPTPASPAHWWSAFRHSFYCSNLLNTKCVTLDGNERKTSAYFRFYQRPAYGDHLHAYNAKLWYVLDDTMRDGAFSASAEVGQYVGVSPDNHRSLWIWNGSRHITVGGSHVIDETPFTKCNTGAPTEPPPTVQPVYAHPTQPTPKPKAAPPTPRQDVHTQLKLPLHTVIRARWETDSELTWYSGSIVGYRITESSGRLYHEIKWLDDRWDGLKKKEMQKYLFIDLSADMPFWQVVGNTTDGVPPAQSEDQSAAEQSRDVPYGVRPEGANRPVVNERRADRPNTSGIAQHDNIAPNIAKAAVRSSTRNKRAHFLLVFVRDQSSAGIGSLLQQLGHEVTWFDLELDPESNLLRPTVLEALRRKIRTGKFDGVFLSPPCKSFSVARATKVRNRALPDGVDESTLTPKDRNFLRKHNQLTIAAALIALEAQNANISWIIENPSDRGDRSNERTFWDEFDDHAPIFMKKEMADLAKAAKATFTTFPYCALGYPVQKFTTLMHCSKLRMLALMDKLKCVHGNQSHEDVAYGANADGTSHGADFELYPPLMSRVVVADLIQNSGSKLPEDEAFVRAVSADLQEAIQRTSSTPISPDSQSNETQGLSAMKSSNSEAMKGEEAQPDYKIQRSNCSEKPVQAVAAGGLRRQAMIAAANSDKKWASLLLHAAEINEDWTVDLHQAEDRQAAVEPKDVADAALAAMMEDASLTGKAQSEIHTPPCATSCTSTQEECNTDLPEWITELKRSPEVYLMAIAQVPDTSPYAILRAAKAKKILSKTVVYKTPEGTMKVIEPRNLKEALESLQHDEWVKAINKEIDNLRSHSAFVLVPEREVLAQGKTVMRTTWVFKVKIYEDSTLEKFKARCAVVGSKQEKGVDFLHSFAQGSRVSSVRICMCFVCVNGWIDIHDDIEGAFLTTDMDVEVFVAQPDGAEKEVGPNGEKMCWKLLKAVYGTKQAARLFVLRLRAALLNIGFEQSIDDESVYRLDHELGRMIISVHMDDIIGGGSNQAVIDYYRKSLIECGLTFSATGKWDTVLGFGVERKGRSFTITAKKHIDTLVENHLGTDAIMPTPSTPSNITIEKLPFLKAETDEERLHNEQWRKPARSLIGGLLYIAQVHAAVQHPVSMLCQHMAFPSPEAYAGAKRVLCWLRLHRDLGLHFSAEGVKMEDLEPPTEPRLPMDGEQKPYLFAAVDSNLNGRTLEAGEIPPKGSWRSQLGFVIFLLGAAIEACSRRQHSTALDTACAELFAASSAAAVLIHVQGVFRFLSFGLLGKKPIPLFCDNVEFSKVHYSLVVYD